MTRCNVAHYQWGCQILFIMDHFSVSVHVDISSLLVNLFVQLAVGLPLEVVHGSFRIGLIYGCGVLFGALTRQLQLGGNDYKKILDFLAFFFSTIFDPYVRLAGASGPAYAMLSAHLANVILHHASMSRPFLRLTGLLAVASLEVGFGIYRRYVRIYLSTNLLCALTIPFFFLHIYPFSKQICSAGSRYTSDKLRCTLGWSCIGSNFRTSYSEKLRTKTERETCLVDNLIGLIYHQPRGLFIPKTET